MTKQDMRDVVTEVVGIGGYKNYIFVGHGGCKKQICVGTQNSKDDGDQDFVGVGGVHEAEVRGNGGQDGGEQNFAGVGGLQNSVRIGVNGFSYINMFRLMIDDRRRMLRGDPVQNIDVRKVHFNSFVGFGAHRQAV